MPNYQVIDADAHNADLKRIGDSIRAKGGTTAPFNSAAEMKAAVDAIKTGGGYPGDTTFDEFIEHGVGTTIINHTAKKIGEKSFFAITGSNKLNRAEFYAATVIETLAFKGMALKTLIIPNLTVVLTEGLEYTKISKLDTKLKDIGNYAFYGCDQLENLILRGNTVADLRYAAKDVFARTPIINKTGYIYVPKALIDQYKSATNWVAIASQIRAIEDYPDITGG